MEKTNKYYSVIENLVRQHKKFPGYEAILEDIIDDVYSHSEVIINSINNESVIQAYLEKVISTSIITVPKKLNYKQNLSGRNRDDVNTVLIDKMINSAHSSEKKVTADLQEPLAAGSVEENMSIQEEPEIFETIDFADDSATLNESIPEEEINLANDFIIQEDENSFVQNNLEIVETLDTDDNSDDTDSITEEDNSTEDNLIAQEVQEDESSFVQDDLEIIETLDTNDDSNNTDSIIEDNSNIEEEEEEESSLSQNDLEIIETLDTNDDNDNSDVFPEEITESEENLTVQDDENSFVQDNLEIVETLDITDENAPNDILDEDTNMADTIDDIETLDIVQDNNGNEQQEETSEQIDIDDDMSFEDDLMLPNDETVETFEITNEQDELNLEYNVEDDLTEELPNADEDITFNFDDDAISPLEDNLEEAEPLEEIFEETSDDVIPQNSNTASTADYSAFSYNPEIDNEDIDIEGISKDLVDLNNKRSELNILKVYELKYKENLSIQEIALQLEMSESNVLEALSEIIAVV